MHIQISIIKSLVNHFLIIQPLILTMTYTSIILVTSELGSLIMDAYPNKYYDVINPKESLSTHTTFDTYNDLYFNYTSY